jgi:hypothetical protein
MTVQEILKKLITAENYLEVRMTISDDFISFVKDTLPTDYDYISEKEENYQQLLEFLKDVKMF